LSSGSGVYSSKVPQQNRRREKELGIVFDEPIFPGLETQNEGYHKSLEVIRRMILEKIHSAGESVNRILRGKKTKNKGNAQEMNKPVGEVIAATTRGKKSNKLLFVKLRPIPKRLLQ
jgi:hypothetical protein